MRTRRRFLSEAGRASAVVAAAGLAQPLLTTIAAAQVSPVPSPPGTGIPALSDGAGSLKSHASSHGLLVGSAVDVGLLTTDAAYRHLLGEQCSIVVAENAMKWPAVHPAPDRYTFDEADTLVDFATQRGMQIRGHNLCWHEALPAWFAATVTTQNAAQVLTDHIRTVAGRYKGRLRAWDVVNEAVAPKDGRPDGLRDSPWLRLLGPGYIDLAFRTARAADPHALLTYNEYGIEYDSPDDAAKRAAVLRLLRTLKAGGTPIDAVGVQSHLSAASPNPLGPGILQFVTEAGTLGLKVFVTELDVNDDRVAVDDQKIRDEAVASVYLNYVTAMLTHPALTDVLTWGVSDNHSWLNHSEDHKEKHPGRQERALPFDAAYQPKLAFYGLRAALDSRMS